MGTADGAVGWWMAGAGESVRSVLPREQSLPRWHDVLPLHVGIQRDLADEVGRCWPSGCPSGG